MANQIENKIDIYKLIDLVNSTENFKANVTPYENQEKFFFVIQKDLDRIVLEVNEITEFESSDITITIKTDNCVVTLWKTIDNIHVQIF